MAFRISGFGAEQREKKEMVSAYEASRRTVAPRKSLVQVRFPGCKRQEKSRPVLEKN